VSSAQPARQARETTNSISGGDPITLRWLRAPAAERQSQGVRIGIVGGGVGGFTAAIALIRKGFDVAVFEQSPTNTC